MKRFVITSVLIFLMLFIANMLIGSYSLGISDLWQFIKGNSLNELQNLVIQTRFNAIITAILAGAGLSVAGLLLQTLFKNPLADPSVLGISSGASLGVAFCLFALGTTQTAIFSSSIVSKHLLVILSSLAGTIPVLLVLLSVSHKTNNKLVILITGLMISFINSSIVSVIEFFSMKESLYSYMLWGMGSFFNVPNNHIIIFSIIIFVVVLFAVFLAKPLNAAMLGDNYAKNTGVNLLSLRFWTITLSGIIIAVITAYCGPIGFVGIAVPHIVKMFTRCADHKKLLPACVLFGSCFSLFCHFISRLPGLDGAMPINVITSIIGAPILIKIMFSPTIKK